MNKIAFEILFCVTVLAGAAQTTPYLNEGFEDSVFPPLGWTVLAAQGDDNPVRRDSGGACGSQYSAVITHNEYWYYGHSDRYFITPKLSPAIGDSLIFWLRINPLFYDNVFTVEVSTGGLAIWEFSVLRTFSVSDFPTSGWLRFAVSVGHFAGQDIYVAFHDIQDEGTAIFFDEVSGVRLHVPDCDTIIVTDDNSYAEDFSVLPECWKLNTGSNSWDYNSTDGYLFHPNGIFSCNAISPVLDISAVTNPYLKFAQLRPCSTTNNHASSLTISYRNLNGSYLGWIPLVTYYDRVDNWQYDSVALPTNISYIQLKFNALGTENNYYQSNLDNVTVYNNVGASVNTAPSVTTRAASAVESHTGTLNATIDNPYYVALTSMGFEWKMSTDSLYTHVPTNTSQFQIPTFVKPFSYTLTDLTENTEYTYHAFITYNDTTIYGEEKSFTTLSCDAPTGLHASDVGLDYITIAWDDDPNVSAWQVWYDPHESGTSPTTGKDTVFASSYTKPYSYIEIEIGSHSGVLTPLVWDFAVRAECSDGTWGPWSNEITVATPYVGIEERLQKAVTLYPNPTTSYVEIRVDGDVNVNGMEMYDVYGKVIRTEVETHHGASLQTKIDISNLSSGMYFVRVSTDHGPVTKPFMKK